MIKWLKKLFKKSVVFDYKNQEHRVKVYYEMINQLNYFIDLLQSETESSVMGYCLILRKSIKQAALDNKFSLNDLDINYATLNDLPELVKYKPVKSKPIEAYWFPTDKAGLNHRISILKEIINQIQNQKDQ